MSASFDFSTTAQEVAEHYYTEAKGRNVLVTGVGPTSLGEETVRVLAPYAKTIVIASRTQSKMEASIKAIKEASPSVEIVPIVLDLSSYEGVKKAAAEVLALNVPLHFVVNNAAVALPPTLTRTKEGNEFQFGSNHLGHFLFISRIWPSIVAAKTADFKPRVVVLSSLAHTWVQPRLDDLNYDARPGEYEKMQAYGHSKLANTLFARGLAKKHADTVVAFSLHPGGILTTGLGSSVTKEQLISMGVMNPDGTLIDPEKWKNVHQGTSTQVYAALAPEIIGQSGAYLQDTKVDEEAATEFAKDPAAVDQLWKISEELVGEKFGSHT